MSSRNTLKNLPYGAFNCRTAWNRDLTPEERVAVCFRDLMRSLFRPQDHPISYFVTHSEAVHWMRLAIKNLNDQEQ